MQERQEEEKANSFSHEFYESQQHIGTNAAKQKLSYSTLFSTSTREQATLLESLKFS